MAFVQAIDGRFYENPVLWGDGWFAHFSGDEPLVAVKRSTRTTPISGKSKISRLLRQFGIEARAIEFYNQTSQYFPPEMVCCDSYQYEFKLVAPIPVPNKFDSVVDEPGGVWDERIYGFWSDVATIDCARAVLGMDIPPLIARALLAHVVYVQGSIRPEICKKLYAQVPWLRGLKHETYEEQLRTVPTTVRIEWRL